jgi:hypothetical protein
MKLPEGDEFYEPYLRFRIVKPPEWEFLPPAWSPAAQLRHNPDFDWMQQASLPFVAFVKKHASEEHAYPSTQATARPLLGTVPDNAQARAILAAQLEQMEQGFDDVEIVTATADRIVAGHRANSLVAEFTLYTERDEEIRAFDVRSRAYSIFTPGMVFSVGMSSSIDECFYDEEEFEEILRSITIG